MSEVPEKEVSYSILFRALNEALAVLHSAALLHQVLYGHVAGPRPRRRPHLEQEAQAPPRDPLQLRKGNAAPRGEQVEGHEPLMWASPI